MTASVFSDVSSSTHPDGPKMATFCFKVVMGDKVQTFCGKFKDKSIFNRLEILEAESLLMGINVARDLGATHIEAFTDHLVVVTSLNNFVPQGWHEKYHDQLKRLRMEGIKVDICGCRGGVQELCHWEAFIRRRLWEPGSKGLLKRVPTHLPEVMAIVNRVKAIKNPVRTRLS